jgi:hypothetical protein
MYRKLTVFDLCNVSGYQRDVLQHALRQLPPYSTQHVEPRKARVFRPHDLIVVAVMFALETKFAVRRKELGKISEQLYNCLNGPRLTSRDPVLTLAFDPPIVQYLEAATPSDEGIVLRLCPIFARVDQYLLGEPSELGKQSSLDLVHVIAPAQLSRGAG